MFGRSFWAGLFFSLVIDIFMVLYGTAEVDNPLRYLYLIIASFLIGVFTNYEVIK